jgi:hypothetical protein
MSNPQMNARASVVNRVHRIVRAEALTMQEQKAKKRSLWAPLLVFSALMGTICYAIWSTLDSYDLAPNGLPDARDQMMLFLLWFVPVTVLVMGLVWFKRGRGNNSEAR